MKIKVWYSPYPGELRISEHEADGYEITEHGDLILKELRKRVMSEREDSSSDKRVPGNPYPEIRAAASYSRGKWTRFVMDYQDA